MCGRKTYNTRRNSVHCGAQISRDKIGANIPEEMKYVNHLCCIFFRRPIEERVVNALGKQWHVEVTFFNFYSLI